MDFQIDPQMFYQRTQGKSATRFGDFPTALNIQLLENTPGSWYPAIKLTVREIFPTGKYQHLSPHKNATDSTGSGSYDTGFGVTFANLYHLSSIYYLSARLSLNYDFFTKTHVEGFNSYGGGFGTRGTVKPGDNYTGLIGLEFTLSKNWVFALDLVAFYGNKSPFRGKRGVTTAGAPADVGFPSFFEFDLAPAIEYNFSEDFGIIAGTWFSVAGRNTQQFVSGLLAISSGTFTFLVMRMFNLKWEEEARVANLKVERSSSSR